MHGVNRGQSPALLAADEQRHTDWVKERLKRGHDLHRETMGSRRPGQVGSQGGSIRRLLQQCSGAGGRARNEEAGSAVLSGERTYKVSGGHAVFVNYLREKQRKAFLTGGRSQGSGAVSTVSLKRRRGGQKDL